MDFLKLFGAKQRKGRIPAYLSARGADAIWRDEGRMAHTKQPYQTRTGARRGEFNEEEFERLIRTQSDDCINQIAAKWISAQDAKHFRGRPAELSELVAEIQWNKEEAA